MAECDPTRCPTGLAYQQINETLAGIRKQTMDTHKVVTDQAVMITQITALHEDFRDLKITNDKEHDEFFARLRIVESSNSKKITVKDMLWYAGAAIAAAGGIIIIVKTIVGV